MRRNGGYPVERKTHAAVDYSSAELKRTICGQPLKRPRPPFGARLVDPSAEGLDALTCDRCRDALHKVTDGVGRPKDGGRFVTRTPAA